MLYTTTRTLRVSLGFRVGLGGFRTQGYFSGFGIVPVLGCLSGFLGCLGFLGF